MKAHSIVIERASSTLLFKRQNLYLSELRWMALGLKGNVTFGYHDVAILDELLGVFVFLIKLRPCVLHNNLAVYLVPDEVVTVDFKLYFHPLVAVISLRPGIDAVARHELIVHDDMRARSAGVARRAFVLAVAAE